MLWYIVIFSETNQVCLYFSYLEIWKYKYSILLIFFCVIKTALTNCWVVKCELCLAIFILSSQRQSGMSVVFCFFLYTWKMYVFFLFCKINKTCRRVECMNSELWLAIFILSSQRQSGMCVVFCFFLYTWKMYVFFLFCKINKTCPRVECMRNLVIQYYILCSHEKFLTICTINALNNCLVKWEFRNVCCNLFVSVRMENVCFFSLLQNK